jgi:pentatricopeptide repeat protein
MITAYAQQGHGTQAVDLYERMLAQNVKPNEVTFVSLLSACSHAGLVSEGYSYFVSMTEVHGLTQWLEHYVCVIDLLGRVGRLAEAEDLVCRMPYESTPAVWSALLGACKLHGDVERAKRIARELSELGKDDETSYVVL